MSFPLYSLFLIILASIFLYKWLLSSSSSSNKCNKKLMHSPPSPPKLPIIGNLHQLGTLPHRSLQSLSQKYGDFMLLHFGNRPTLVVSSVTAAEDIMKTREHFFLNRPKLRFIDTLFYGGSDVGFSSYDENWRYRKSICVMHLLSNQRVGSFRPIREEEVSQMMEEIKSYGGKSAVNLSEIAAKLFKGIICRTALGKKYKDGYDGRKNVYQMFKELSEVMGAISVGDYVPFLGWIDRLSGLETRVENVRKQFDEFIEEIVQEHEMQLFMTGKHGYNINDDEEEEEEEEKEKNVKDFVQVLLEIQRDNPEQLSRDSIKAVILDILGAGTDTSTTMLEWAMKELIRHPKVMKKLQEEVRQIFKTNTKVSEHHLESMKYLKAVTKETLRLHPPVPLSGFRESSRNIEIDRYSIDARSQVIVNAWAIQRDPRFWQDPENFYPDRFLNDDACYVDYKGHCFQFIPFGAGRRGCPGRTFAIVNFELALANLMYEFNWKLPNGREDKTLDVEESWGVSVRPQNPLVVIATPNVMPNTTIS